MSEQHSTESRAASGMPPMKDARRPVHTVRYRNIKAAIWQNQTASGPVFNVTVSRSWLDGDVWKDSSGFGYEDLLLLAKALNDAHTWITEQRRRMSEAKRDEEPAGA